MARGIANSTLLALLKGQLRVDADSSVSPGGDDVMYAALEEMQDFLSIEYDWPFLELRTDITMVPGTRYYDFPTGDNGETYNMEREIIAECYWSNLWYTVESGIKLINYNVLNPELNQMLDPVLRWQPYNANGVEFEVWPLPATATRLRLTGQRTLNPLIAPTDTSDLDGRLIVLFTAAEMAAQLGMADADKKAARAMARLNRLRGGIVSPSQVFSMRGTRGGNRRHEDRYARPMVGVNYTPPS